MNAMVWYSVPLCNGFVNGMSDLCTSTLLCLYLKNFFHLN